MPITYNNYKSNIYTMDRTYEDTIRQFVYAIPKLPDSPIYFSDNIYGQLSAKTYITSPIPVIEIGTRYDSPKIGFSTENKSVVDSTPASPPGFTYRTRGDIVANTGNVSPGSIFLRAGRNGLQGLASGIGNPLTSQISQPLISTLWKSRDIANDGRGDNMDQPYAIMPFTRKEQLINWNLTKFKDFRAFKGLSFSVDNVRLDGASAATRGIYNLDTKSSILSTIYAAATVVPGGAYTLFNLESIYGWGNHGDSNALRRDFTSRTNVATKWKAGTTPKDGKWVPTANPIERATEFRGDKISVIDFGQRKLKDVYVWKPQWFTGNENWNGFNRFLSEADLTKDFIKFYFTGPKLNSGNTTDTDDIIVFRAIIDSFTDTHSPSWQSVQMIGRADPNYMYTGYSREISLSFDIYATSRDEMKPIYRKLNALTGYTTPDYSADTIAMKSPWMRITIGDLLIQQPVIITSLSYTFIDADTTWEINVEQDAAMMEAPHKISVTMGLNVLTDWLPEKNGKFYSLAKKFSAVGTPIEGGDNWLSDFGKTDQNEKILRKQAASEEIDTKYKI